MAVINDIFLGEVRDLASDGRGVVVHPSGRTIFVDGVWVGEKGEFKITELKGRVGFAKIVDIHEASPQRIAPVCKHHGFGKNTCGGCPWQFMEYSAQLAAKQLRVTNELTRLNVRDQTQDIWPSSTVVGYRNRAQFKTDGTKLGFLAAHSRHITDVKDCVILSEKNRETLSAMRETMPNSVWRVSSKDFKKQVWTSLDIDESTDISTVSVNQRLPFQQANSEQNQRMRDWLTTKLQEISVQLPNGMNVLELFCGAGNFTEVIAQMDNTQVLAVESVSAALASLNAKKLSNVRTCEVNLFLETAFEKIYNQQRDFDVLVLDPPRDGLKNKKDLLPKKSKIKHVLYVSCDLATFSRDLAYFQENKFKVVEVQPLDQFPHTAHVELMAYLSRT